MEIPGSDSKAKLKIGFGLLVNNAGSCIPAIQVEIVDTVNDSLTTGPCKVRNFEAFRRNYDSIFSGKAADNTGNN